MLVGGGGGKVAQIENVPLLLLPNSQNLIHKVEPGVRPDLVINGIAPLGLSSSSHSRNVRLVQVPVYTAIPPSNITPVCEFIVTEPEAGTVRVNHTSPPE